MGERGQVGKPLRDLIEIIRFTEKVSAKTHGVLDEAQIYEVIKGEFVRSKRYTASILLLTDDGLALRIAEMAIPPGKLKAVAKATGLVLGDCQIDLHRSIQASVRDILDELFPRPSASLILKALSHGRSSAILTPLKRHGKIIGVFGMTFTGMTEYLVPSVKNLAQHVSTALELADEYAECKRAEEALRKSEERFRRLFEHSGDAVFVHNFAGQILNVNSRACELTGYSHDQLLAMRVSDIYSAEASPSFAGAFQTVGQEGTGRFGSQLRRADGAIIDVEINSRVVDAEEGIVQEIARDVTEPRRAEEMLLQRNRELSLLYRAGQVFSSTLDLDQVLALVLEEVRGMLDVTGCSVWLSDPKTDDLVCQQAAGSRSEIVRGWRLALGEGLVGWVVRHGESLIVSDAMEDERHSKQVDLQTGLPLRSVLTVPLQGKEGVIGVLQVVDAEADRFSAEDQALLETLVASAAAAIENARLARGATEVELLHEMDRLRSELIANVSHELRTPLGLIKVFCTTMLRDDVEFAPEMRREFLQSIDDETDKLEKIVDDLLDLSRIEGGRLQLDRHPTDIGQLAKEVVGGLKVQFPRHRLLCGFPSEPLVATVDAKRIEQVLRNLVGNAVKYSTDGGTVTIRGHRDEGRILVSVEDEGSGIPAQDLDRIFERFYRVESELTQRVRGAGLGLAVCRGIVEAHGGRIWAESMVGEGSTFYFTLGSEA
jgi:PAS domain S-box-containing protein